MEDDIYKGEVIVLSESGFTYMKLGDFLVEYAISKKMDGEVAESMFFEAAIYNGSDSTIDTQGYLISKGSVCCPFNLQEEIYEDVPQEVETWITENGG